MQSNKKNYFKLFLIMLIFVLPLIVSDYLYMHHRNFQFKTTNHGVLVSPVVPVKELTPAANVKGKWQIVFMTNGCCDAQCDKTMFTLHQLRKALGNNSERVNLVLITDTTCVIKDTHDFAKLNFTSQQYTNLETAISNNGDKNFLVKNKIYLVDPQGNLLMYYPGDVDQMNILKDIKHLLEVSQIG